MFIRRLPVQSRSTNWTKAAISSVFLIGAIIETGNTALAQITPDRTLTNNSTVTTSGKTFVIEGGTQAGNNLFHSFTQFSLPTNNTAYFNNALSIHNIFSRVTGSEVSNIDGLIKANGIANLFLLNPNGIIFGPNARLDVGGSFVASTANRINFADGKQFSTQAAQTPLLSVSIPIGLQLNANSHSISNAGSLAVKQGENLTLLAGAVNHTGSLTAPGGTVQLLGKQVGLFEHANIDVSSAAGGGTVLIGGDFQGKGAVPNAARTYVGPIVTIKADALKTGNGGNVVVWADEVTGFYGKIEARGGSVSGNGGLVEVSGKQQLIFRGDVNASAPQGIAGTLFLDPTNITIANGSGDAVGDGTNTFAGNNSNVAGNILTAPLSQITDTAPTTIYESELEGLSGNTNIVLQATNNIILQDLADNTLNLAAGSGKINFTADADADGVGNFVMDDLADTIKTNGRDIAITGANLTLGNIDTSLVVGGGLLAAVNIDSGGAIPTTGTSGDATFTFTVPNLGSNISSLGVQFSASHTWDSDLNVSLTSPQGTTLNLFNAVGSNGDNFQDTVLDDGAATSINNGSPPFAGRFKPSGSGGLAVFNGENPAGTWVLRLRDCCKGDSGTLYKAGDSTAPWGTALGTQLLFASPITAAGSGAINLTATNGSLDVGQLNASYLTGIGTIQRTGDITLTGNEINLNGTVSGLGNLTLQPSNPNQAIALGGIDNGSTSTLNLTTPEINRLQNGFKSITIGSADSSGAISLTGNVSFADPVTLRSPNDSGSINTTGFNFAGTDDATINFLANQNITTGAITNLGRNININSTKGNIDITRLINVSSGQFNAGNVAINAGDNLQITGQIRANSSSGAGGNISLTSGNTLSIIDEGFVNSRSNQNINSSSLQPGGNISLSAPSIVLENGGQASVSIRGAGQGGNLFVNADEVKIINGGGLTSTTSGLGDAGDITINTRRLLLQNTISDSKITFENLDKFRTGVSTFVQRFPDTTASDFVNFIFGGSSSLFNTSDFNTGSGGNITINASESVELIGNQPGSFTPKFDLSTVSTAVQLSTGITAGTIANGASGKVEINTDKLIVQDGAGISTASVAPGFLPKIFPDVVTSFAESRIPPELGFFRNNIIEIVNSQLSNITTAGAGGDLIINANQIDLQGTGGLTSATLSTSRAGDLSINANNRVTLRNGAGIAVSTFTEGDAGNLSIKTNQLSLHEGSRIGAGTASKGFGGNLSITASNIELDGISADGQVSSDLSATALEGSTGDAGNLTIATRQLTIKNGAQVSAATSGTGSSGNISVQDAELVLLDNGFISTAVNPTASINNPDKIQSGKIDIQTRNLSLTNGARVTASTSGKGDAGSITIRQADSVNVDKSSISTAVNTNAVGQGGNVELQTRNLSLSNGAQVSAATSGTGDAGSIVIQDAESVALSQSKISSEATEANSNGGSVTINTQKLSVQDSSEVSASYVAGPSQEINQRQSNFFAALNENQTTASPVKGRAGNLSINAPESVLVSGDSSLSVEATAGGTAGNLTVNTGKFNISDDSRVSVSSPQGQAGNLEIAANSLFLDRGFMTAETGEQGGANIRLERLNTLLLRNESLISATANGTANGGNIDINTTFLIALPSQGLFGNDIIANAEFGNGGRIDVNAQAIFGIAFQPQQTSGNDFTASSKFGRQGEVQINSLAEPNSTLTELPENLVDSSGLISQNACQQISDSKFSVTGRGGLPPTPSETLGGDVVWSDTRLRSFASQAEITRNLAHTQNLVPNVEAAPIRSATGWLFNNWGEVILIANTPNTNAESWKTYPATCSQK